MNELFFWNNWQKTQRIPYLILLSLFILSLVWYGIQYGLGDGMVMGWQLKTETELIDVPIDTIQKGIFKLNVEGESYVVTEKYEAKAPQINYTANYFFLSFQILAAVFLLAMLTILKRLWYIIGITVFVFYLINLQVNYLGLTDFYEHAFLILMMLLYLPLSYYFQAFQTSTAFHWRLISFAAITVIIALWVVFGSNVPDPALYLSTFGMIIPIVLSLIFISIVAHDIPYIFVYLLSRYSNPGIKRNTLFHYIFITFIYLLNLFLIHLEEVNAINWNIYYLDIFVVYIISVVLGIWGYKQRNLIAQKSILPFEPQGAILYLSLAMISLGTIAYAFATANDSLIRVFRDFILFTHIGFGTIFFCYILINFAPLLRENLAVYRIVYKGDVFPFNLARFIAVVVICVFFMAEFEKDYYRIKSSYYNGIAEIYASTEEDILAEEYYLLALKNNYFSQKTRFELAFLAIKQNQPQRVISFIKNNTEINPSEYAFTMLSDTYLESDMFYDALFVLQKGVKKFPRSAALNNNLALLYAQAKVQDSTLYHFRMAQRHTSGFVPLNNLYAYLAKEQIKDISIDSLVFEDKGVISLSNQLALYNVYGKRYERDIDTAFFQNPEIDIKAFAYLYNYTTNQLKKQDTSRQLVKLIEKIQANEKNYPIYGSLQFLKGVYHYYQQNIAEGIKTVSGLPDLKSAPYYNTILGLWFLEQNAYKQAGNSFAKAIELGDKEAIAYNAITFSELKNTEEAKYYWKQVLANKESTIGILAAKVLKILEDSSSIDLKTDEEKYNFIHYRGNRISEEQRLKIYQSIENMGFKTWVAAELMHDYIDKDSLRRAGLIWDGKPESPQAVDFVKSAINYAYLRLLLARQDYKGLSDALDNLLLIKPHIHKIPYFKAVILENGKEFEKAGIYYAKALASNPFDEDVLIKIALYYKNYKKDNEKSYNILLDASKTNPYSVRILKEYALQSIEIGVGYYGEDALQDIRKLTTQEDYDSFAKIFQEKRKSKLTF